MNEFHYRQLASRRAFLERTAGGLGAIALWNLLQKDSRAAEPANPLALKPSHFPGKAKNVIYLFMEGGPSQLDLFVPKPGMSKYDGQSLPPSMTKDMRFAFIKPTAKIWASPRPFQPHGQSGLTFSDYLPHTAQCADDLCMVHSMVTEQFNHHPAQLMINAGSPLVGRPSLGAWTTYGLGSESESLPAFVVLNSGRGPTAGSQLFTNGFLPPVFQGTPFRSSGDPVLHLRNPESVTAAEQRARIDAIGDLNRIRLEETGDMEIAARIAAYELAFRMQAEAPELLDLSKETPATLAAYGLDGKEPNAFASNCLLARRMVERGVRFVQLIHASWDDHNNLNKGLRKNCEITDQPVAALLKDLKQRGLLNDTLVIWGGEFGRTPFVEDNRPGEDTRGRDHHPAAFTMWMAGGGAKGGASHGETDELGLGVTKDKVHVHDLHATILHMLGIDHRKLTFRHQGRDFRLTDVAGHVVKPLLA